MNREEDEIRAYTEAVGRLCFTATQKERIARRLIEEAGRQITRKEEERNMKRWNIKKTAAAAAVVLLASGGVSYAAGRISTIASGSSPLDYVHDYDAVAEAEEKAGFDVDLVERFANGYAFDSVAALEDYGYDEAGRLSESWMEISAVYLSADGETSLHVTAQPEQYYHSDPEVIRQEYTIDGVTVEYGVDEYLFLPADYEEQGLLDDATRERMENDPNFYVSYGSSEVETDFFSHASFCKDGILYLIFQMNSELSAEEFLEMSEELIAQ